MILKNYFITYKPFLIFLGKFLLTYLLLITVYQFYLSQFDVKKNEIDGFTQIVSDQTEAVLLFFDYKLETAPNLNEPAVNFKLNQRPIIRIVEGCNALSVIILFVSFIVAFSGKIKQTVLFIVFGSLFVHVLNISRIAALCVLLYDHPEQLHLLHGVIFPLIIYGAVFVLWIIWMNKFSTYAKESVSK